MGWGETAVNAERRRRLIALGELHDRWVRENAASTSAHFDPSGRKTGSDYNQHHVDLDADGAAQDDFHEQAMRIIEGRP